MSSDCLTIEPWSGIVRLTRELDRESMSRHVLTLEVADSRFTKLGHRNHFRSLDGDMNQMNLIDGGRNLIDPVDEGTFSNPPIPNPPPPTLMPFAASSHRAFTQLFINVIDVNDHPVRIFLIFLIFFLSIFSIFLSFSVSQFFLFSQER